MIKLIKLFLVLLALGALVLAGCVDKTPVATPAPILLWTHDKHVVFDFDLFNQTDYNFSHVGNTSVTCNVKTFCYVKGSTSEYSQTIGKSCEMDLRDNIFQLLYGAHAEIDTGIILRDNRIDSENLLEPSNFMGKIYGHEFSLVFTRSFPDYYTDIVDCDG